MLQENIAQNAELARKSRQSPVNHWALAKSAMLLSMRLGDLPGAEADLELADASIVRHASGGNIWPPSAWFAPPTAEDERFADETYDENKAFIRGVLHFVRTHDSTKPVIPVPLWPGPWLNLVEVWFGIIERQAIHRGSFGSVKDLNAKIRLFVTGWNDRCHPFVWTKTADQILKKTKPSTTSKTAH